MKPNKLRFLLIRKSSNRKTGPMANTYTAAASCPDACPLKGRGCYAASGFTRFPWVRADKGSTFKQFLKEIETLEPGPLRHNVGGDLPGENDKLDREMCLTLADAYVKQGMRAYTYTHYPVTKHKHAAHNRRVIKAMNKRGFTVNLSANTLTQAAEYATLGIGPVATIVLDGQPKFSVTQEKPVIVCPAQVRDTNCHDCMACANKNRKAIIGFLPHGTYKKTVNQIAST